MLKYSEAKGWDKPTILGKVKELRTELFKMRMQKTTTGIAKPHLLKQYKKEIAILLTSLNSQSEK